MTEKKNPADSSNIEGELELAIGVSERTYANPELDALIDKAITLAVSDRDSLEVEAQIEEGKPSREWVLLQGYKGYKARAAIYRNVNEPGLEQSALAEAMVRAKAIMRGRDVEATTLPLPPLSVELHNAIENLAFFSK